MRQLDRVAVVEANDKVPGCWLVHSNPAERPDFSPDMKLPSPQIIAQFNTVGTEVADGFSAKALAIEYARAKFSRVTVKD